MIITETLSAHTRSSTDSTLAMPKPESPRNMRCRLFRFELGTLIAVYDDAPRTYPDAMNEIPPGLRNAELVATVEAPAPRIAERVQEVVSQFDCPHEIVNWALRQCA